MLADATFCLAQAGPDRASTVSTLSTPTSAPTANPFPGFFATVVWSTIS
jgi:hypothetical protein